MKATPFIVDPSPKNIRKDIETNPRAFLKATLTGSPYDFGVTEILNTGTYKEMGYRYDFRPLLKRYVYKRYDSWTEAFALNKANLRALVLGNIDEILEA